MDTYIPQGTRYGIPLANGKFTWEDSDREVDIQVTGFDSVFVRFKPMESLCSSQGAIAPGTELVTTNQWIKDRSDLTLEDTQKITLEDEESLANVEKIIANLRESIYDFERKPNFAYDPDILDRIKSMKRNLYKAKKEREIILRKIADTPNKDKEPFDPFGIGIFW